MEHEKLSQSPLLKADRTLSEEGWAKSALWSYSRKEAKASGLREADSYIVIDPERSFIMLIDFTSNGMKASHRIIYVDTQRGEAAEVLSSKVSLSKSSPLPEDPTSDSEISFADHAMTLAAVKRGKKRQLLITAPYLELPDGKSGLKAHIELLSKNDEMISAAFAAEKDRTKWGLRSIESPMEAEGIMFIGHKPVMLSPSASGAFCYTRSKLPRPVTAATIIGNGWSINAGEDRYINSITIEGRIDKLGSMLFSRMPDKWIVSEENSRVEIEAGIIAVIDSPGIKREFIRCSGSFARENGDTVVFSDALGIISYQGM